MKTRPEPGTTVQFTGDFLRSTGQYTGPEATGKWIVVECACGLCGHGPFCALNQPHLCQEDPTGYEDVPVEQRPKWRHVNYHNVEKTYRRLQ